MAGKVKKVKANKRKDYEIPANEDHLVHAEIEDRSFNQATGEKTSKPFIQSFYPDEFDKSVADGHFKGKSVEVLHDPRSKKEQTQGEIDATIDSPLTNELMRKPLDKMTPDELRAKYANLYKDEAEPGASVDSLRQDITDKIEFLRSEEAATKLNQKQVAEDDGSGKPLGADGKGGNVAVDADATTVKTAGKK